MPENQVQVEKKPLSERDFLKILALLVGAGAIAPFLAACEDIEDDVPVGLEQLQWDRTALDKLEARADLHESVYINGDAATATLRVLVFANNDNQPGGNHIKSFIPAINPGIENPDNQIKEQQMVENFVKDEIDKIMIIQHKVHDETTGQDKWVSIKVPGSYFHLITAQYYAQKLPPQVDYENISTQINELAVNFPNLVQSASKEEIARTALASVLEALLNPELSEEKTAEILRVHLFPVHMTTDGQDPFTHEGWMELAKVLKTQFSSIPNNLPIEKWLDIYRANLSAFDDTVFDTVNGIAYTKRQLWKTILQQSGAAYPDCIVVPKQVTEGNKQLEAICNDVKKEFAPIPPKPRVFKISYGGVVRLAVINNIERYDPTLNRVIEPWDERISIDNLLHEYNAQHGTSLSWGAVGTALNKDQLAFDLKKRIALLVGIKPEELLVAEEFPPEALDMVMVPNKFYGDLHERMSWAILVNGYEEAEGVMNPTGRQELKAVMLSPNLRDGITPVQAVDQTKKETLSVNGTQENWLTVVTDIINQLDAGITEVYKEGLLDAKSFLARMIRRAENSELFEHPFLQPGDSVMAKLLADAKLADLLQANRSENPSKGVNMAVALADITLQRIDLVDFYADGATLEKFAGKLGIGTGDKIWQDFEGAVQKWSPEKSLLEDKLKKQPFIHDDHEVMLYQGDFFPIMKVIQIGDKKYLILKEVKIDDGSFASRTASFIAIPFEEALRKVLILDPDNNVLEMARDIADLALPVFMASMVLMPGPTGVAVTMTGKEIQTQLHKLFTYLASKVETALLQ